MDQTSFFLEAGRRLQKVKVVYHTEHRIYRYLFEKDQQLLLTANPSSPWVLISPSLPFPHAVRERKRLEALDLEALEAKTLAPLITCSVLGDLTPSSQPVMSPYSTISSIITGRQLRLEELWKAYGQLSLQNSLLPQEHHIRHFFHLLHQLHWNNDVEWLPGTALDHHGKPACSRCGAREGEELKQVPCQLCEAAGQTCYACSSCSSLGQIRSCSLIIRGMPESFQPLHLAALNPIFPNHPTFHPSSNLPSTSISHQRSIHGSPHHAGIEILNLTPAQQEAANQVVATLQQHHVQAGKSEEQGKRNSAGDSFWPHLLLWAVCGAGKTEMLLPAIAWALEQGLRVAITTPRKDVVLELLPRFQQYFPYTEMVALYGGHQSWERPALIICTTHQLLRFHHAFHLLILDEMDAFPYHHSPLLPRAVQRALHPQGFFLALTATPARAEQRASLRGQLPTVTIPVRFHHHPLPVPRLCRHSPRARRLPQRFQKLLRWFEERWQKVMDGMGDDMGDSSVLPSLFLFVPRKREIGQLQAYFQQHTSLSMESTHADDPERIQKVEAFRRKEFPILLCTSILERGVTISNSHVVVWEADAAIWDEAALVQMAGRAGRNAQYPTGHILFVVTQPTLAVRHAIAHIRRMNRLAKKGGYL